MKDEKEYEKRTGEAGAFFRVSGEEMVDKFILAQMLPLLHAAVCIYDEDGKVLHAFEDVTEKKLIEPEDFQKIEWKPSLPYIHVEENGIAFCVMQSGTEGELIGIGKLRLYDFADEAAYQYPYCGKDEFGAVIAILWKLVSGKEVGVGTLWAENVDIGFSLKQQMAKELFTLQEEGRYHKPYEQEQQELDSIQRGDAAALQRCIDKVYSGTAGVLANDMIRQYKNLAISKIVLASRSAIRGGLSPELALTMSDTFIRNMEEHLSEPAKIEKAAREAEFEFTAAVYNLNKPEYSNPLIDQVRDYVFRHIHESIRVKEIAEEVGVTPNYLSEQFSQCMGVTLRQYIIDEKIASSRQLLKYSDFSLQEISSFFAFSSQSRFSVYFQRKYGVTPAKFRKSFRKEEMDRK